MASFGFHDRDQYTEYHYFHDQHCSPGYVKVPLNNNTSYTLFAKELFVDVARGSFGKPLVSNYLFKWK